MLVGRDAIYGFSTVVNYTVSHALTRDKGWKLGVVMSPPQPIQYKPEF
ncbi:hypothetical protein H1P_280004 [Hyella patelloides LEGE 07179]|uniref:Uncharacterized protein n=1 Tax=Hyella patelloides LEGE 07179 TaxID=945734 RepID=A0A563VTC3_9CYAN|nr:hypothetical protein H1P_280004 [Hyella patelloides LEGE 07179]